MQEVEVGEVVRSLVEANPLQQERVVQARFSKLDIQYLQRKTGLNHRFVGRMLRIFGEAVVLESLRRFATGYQYASGREEAVFVGICKAVESVGKEG